MSTDGRITSFEDLKCWQACRELRLFVMREIIPVLPKDEKYRLVDQMLRAARSATANIAEGYGRFHYLDNSKFCSNSRGSCCEVLDHLITSNDDGLISDDLLRHGREKVSTALKLINGYISYLRRAQNGDHSSVREPSGDYGDDCEVYALPNNE
jgi:four helix bundle protein